VNLLVTLLQIHTPEYVRKRALSQLFKFTVAAFGCDVPPILTLSSDECLLQYALFTQSHVEGLIRDGRDLETVQHCLYQNAVELGKMHGKRLRIHTIEDTMAIGRVLYRILGIEFQGNAQGEVVIRRCHFSRFYSSQVCQIMSAMDRGLFAGLSNGGQLDFSSRITEGQPYCRAHFALWEDTK